MTRHQLTYIDLRPEPVIEPSTAAVWLGAAVFMLCLWAVLFLALCL
jgi:hypothetical protein